MSTALDKCIPVKKVKLRLHDKKFMTGELKILDRQIKREYTKHGKSQKFLLMKETFKNLYKKESTRFLYKNVNSLLTTKPGRAYKILKTMGARIGEDTNSTNFNLPQFQECSC